MVLKKTKKHQCKILIGVFLLITSLSLLIHYNYSNNKQVKEEKINIENFFNATTIPTPETITRENTTASKEETKISKNYIAILKIPKINLEKGLVNPNSKYNNVEYNIKIIESSTFPDKDNGNLILAAHNGSYPNAYFKDLDKLNIKDKIYIYYNNIKYEYILTKIYDTKKDGYVEITRTLNKTTLTLITCKTNTNDKQVIYISYLNSKEPYTN